MREHGTYVKYVIEKCRCDECRRANTEYERDRNRRKLYGGKWWQWVDAEPARRRVRSLMAPSVGSSEGMGWKRIAREAGLSPSVVWKLLYGDRQRSMPPSRRIHRDTEAALLSVRRDLADGATVDAGPTWALLDCLISYGVPKARIAGALGAKAPSLQVSRRMVRLSTARKVEELHWELWKRSADLRRHCTCVPPAEIAEYLEVSA